MTQNIEDRVFRKLQLIEDYVFDTLPSGYESATIFFKNLRGWCISNRRVPSMAFSMLWLGYEIARKEGE